MTYNEITQRAIAALNQKAEAGESVGPMDISLSMEFLYDYGVTPEEYLDNLDSWEDGG